MGLFSAGVSLRIYGTISAKRKDLYMELTDNFQEVLSPYHVIDADAHYTEPPDLWTSRAPASMRERVPHVKRVDGVDRWFIEGDQDFGPVGLCIIDKAGNKHYDVGITSLATFDEVHDAAMNVKARLDLMDTLGIWAQVVYPNAAGLSSLKFFDAVSDADLRLASLKIYNDAIAEWQSESGDRLVPQALMPIWDRVALEQEAQRAVEELGLRGIVISDKPESMGLPNYSNEYWAGFWEFCSSTSTPVDFHVGGGKTEGSGLHLSEVQWDNFGPETTVAIWTCMATMFNARSNCELLL